MWHKQLHQFLGQSSHSHLGLAQGHRRHLQCQNPDLVGDDDDDDDNDDNDTGDDDEFELKVAVWNKRGNKQELDLFDLLSLLYI